MTLPFVRLAVDERFLMHRLRSTSLAGIAAALVAAAIWAWHYYGRHEFRWDLFAVLATAAVVKLAAMVYYRLTD